MEWICVLVPAIAICTLKHMYPKRVTWLEMVLPVAIASIMVLIGNSIVASTLTADSERWGGWVAKTEYYEDWNEYIHRTCTRTDSKGKTETYDCSYVDYHPPKWIVHTSNGETIDISESTFNAISNKFGNIKFVNMNRWYYTNDGDLYTASWDGNDSRFQSVYTQHYFENRVKANNGLFSYDHISNPQELGLYEYPYIRDNFNDPAVLGSCDKASQADTLLQKFNAKYGASKQVRCWLLLFKNRPHDIGFKQESYWVGGKKNEFTLCVNIDNNNRVTWVHAFCWFPDGYAGNDAIKFSLRDEFTDTELDVISIVNSMTSKIKQKWKRKSFKEFSYLSIRMPKSYTIVMFILIITMTAFVAYAVVQNNLSTDNDETMSSISNFFSRKSGGTYNRTHKAATSDFHSTAKKR